MIPTRAAKRQAPPTLGLIKNWPLSIQQNPISAGQLVANIKAFAEAVNKAKPAGAKGHFVEKISLSSTMGPGLKIAPESVFRA